MNRRGLAAQGIRLTFDQYIVMKPGLAIMTAVLATLGGFLFLWIIVKAQTDKYEVRPIRRASGPGRRYISNGWYGHPQTAHGGQRVRIVRQPGYYGHGPIASVMEAHPYRGSRVLSPYSYRY